MHCARHVGNPRLHTCERALCLALLFVISAIAISCAVVFLKRHLFRPTVVSIDRDYMNWGIILPSLTFCEHEKLNETALELYLEGREEDPKLERFLRHLVNLSIYNLDTLPRYTDIEPKEYLNLMNSLTNIYDNRVVFTAMNISIPLVRVMTEMGICWAFNSKLYPFNSIEYHMNGEEKVAPQILQAIYPHADNFPILIAMNGSSYDIFWHNPSDYPAADQVIEMDRETPTYTSLIFRSFQLYCTDKVRRLLIYQRQCRFDDESNLDHFPHFYSYGLCRTECKIQRMLEFCGCVPVFYRATQSEVYCGVQDMKCIAFHRIKIEQMSRNCDCLSRCEGIVYNLDIVDMIYWFGKSTIKWELMTSKYRYKREVVYGIEEVLVAIGANAGLFLGLSTLSFLEFTFYYFIHIFQFDRRRLNEL
ncbi:sodium channel protein Nach-like [Phlebotomus argentipes]|uniref:sodium channel protein Nach-like n=1 Tax=Phlebotomus argentipes TaxID=94469 RepID=UPI00289353DC|nr:sodium channel protein Nach-like [Phlebotomus argentipes]